MVYQTDQGEAPSRILMVLTNHNGPKNFQYHTSWSVGSEGTTLTSGSIRVQRHPSQVSVGRGKFYSIWHYLLYYLLSLSVSKISPDLQRPGRGVVGLVLTHWLMWYPQNPPIINFYLEKKWTVVDALLSWASLSVVSTYVDSNVPPTGRSKYHFF